MFNFVPFKKNLTLFGLLLRKLQLFKALNVPILLNSVDNWPKTSPRKRIPWQKIKLHKTRPWNSLFFMLNPWTDGIRALWALCCLTAVGSVGRGTTRPFPCHGLAFLWTTTRGPRPCTEPMKVLTYDSVSHPALRRILQHLGLLDNRFVQLIL